MVDTRVLATFVVASFLLIIVPGPSVLFVISRGVALGRKAALLTVLGNETGVMVQVLVVAAGLGVGARALGACCSTCSGSAGAAYLVYLGVQADPTPTRAVHRARRHRDPPEPSHRPRGVRGRRHQPQGDHLLHGRPAAVRRARRRSGAAPALRARHDLRARSRCIWTAAGAWPRVPRGPGWPVVRTASSGSAASAAS